MQASLDTIQNAEEVREVANLTCEYVCIFFQIMGSSRVIELYCAYHWNCRKQELQKGEKKKSI